MRLGVGPWFGLIAAAYFVPAVTAHALLHPAFVIRGVPAVGVRVAGGVLVACAVVVYLWALLTLRRGLRRGELVTRGPYALVRHPLYASNILFTAPGLALLIRSWLLVPLPIVMYAACRLLLANEEKRLEDRFGEPYGAYRRSTPALLPFGRRKGAPHAPP